MYWHVDSDMGVPVLAVAHTALALGWGPTIRRKWNGPDRLGARAAGIAWAVACIGVILAVTAEFVIRGADGPVVGGLGIGVVLVAWVGFAIVRIIVDFLPDSQKPAA